MANRPLPDIAIADNERSFAEACVDAKLSLFARGGDLEEAHLLAYHPPVQRNPYQQMLYASAYEHSFACFSLKDHAEAAPPPVNAPLGVHYHWVHRVFAECRTSKDAKRAVQGFFDVVDRHRDAGIKIIWTVHNLLSHSAAFPEEEIELRAGLGTRADFIHIMNPATVELCGRYYELSSSKTFMVPHPSYFGVYGDYISAEQARFDLGIAPEDKTVLLFGSLGPHKGTRQFLEELDDLETKINCRLRVLIAGRPGDGAYMEDIYRLVADKPRVLLIEHHIDDQAVQRLFRAADAILCPYDVGLNSGVAATAATFGRPCVVPDILVPAMSGANAGVIGFNPSNRDSLAIAVSRALESSENPVTETALYQWAEGHRPVAISRLFFEALRERW